MCAILTPAQAPAPEVIRIDPNAASKPFPHFWERMFGSGRAILSLREDWRRDLQATKTAVNLEYVRFHAIFQDEVGVYDENQQGKPIYNWSYVDQIYDGLLASNVRPFVELSFMPRKLSATDKLHAFWYKPYPNPPKDYGRWGELVEAFTRHLVERYGIDEVSRWYFEVWNEPNIDFWTGEPKESTYYELYDAAARAVKQVSTRLPVGGPATAQAAWWTGSSHTARRLEYRPILFPHMSTATTPPATSSVRTRASHAAIWSAVLSARFMTRFNARLCRTFLSSGASTTRVT